MFRRNPVYQKEISTDARASRIFLMIVIFNCVLSVVAFVMFYSTFNGVSSMGAVNYDSLAELYTIMAYIEFGMVMLIIPATTAGAITGERERKTLDIMLVGSRHARTIVFGKFFSNIRLISVAMISSIPVLSMVFIYGGIKLSYLFLLFLIIMIAGMYIGSVGIFCSSICKRTTSAIVMAYALFVALMLITIALNYTAVKLDSDRSYASEYFVLYFNPIAPLTYFISNQLDSVNGFTKLLFSDITYESITIGMNRWLLYSGIAQVMVSFILLNVSALIINPLKFSLFRRMVKRYVYGEKNTEN